MSQKIYTVVDRFDCDETYGTFSTMDKANSVRKVLMDHHGMTEENWNPSKDKHMFVVNVTDLDRIYPYFVKDWGITIDIMEVLK